MKRYRSSIIVALLFFAIWQALAMYIDAMYILPSPTAILEKIWELKDILFLVHLPATLLITIEGLLISIVLGVVLAVAMNISERIQRALYPIVIVTQTVPITALAPIFILWFGYGIWSKVLVTVLITFFPITINVYDGLRSTRKDMEELLITYGASKKDIFMKLKFPASLPYFFSALKMAVPLSVVGAAVSEWLGAEAGLGYFSKRMMTQMDGAGVFAPIVILSLAALILVEILNVLENKIVKWRNEV
ncbi:ABC transporter permease [Clostridium autoethanogenum]|uniref:ABC transporter permease n=2 Tax=Clostridium autoethanogenum TaxID=84023 RepID=A0A3M0S0S5_9CLOT|nr:ABC transporter permease [Clostridium autoethanogenum]AGY74837.1 ABC transporter permease [Clostridium autoethanogenum DSM 10061]ALU35014.1 ABC-type transport system permease component [Clostridium autoethanogenum DSM 10061]OVY49487.1 putative aliphatic sulfonates transport permease protein SsuC [Clostridium autoethanogenum]RMC92176.1 ABC transporter permease [Clostridium autoethanogenum]